MKAPSFSAYAKTPQQVAATLQELRYEAEAHERERRRQQEADKCPRCHGTGEKYETWAVRSGGEAGGWLPCHRCNGHG